MLIACPSCATSYQVELASLGRGRSVRCARCRTVWFASTADAVRAMMDASAEAGTQAAATVAAEKEAADDGIDWSALNPGPATATASGPSVEMDAPPLVPSSDQDAAAPAKGAKIPSPAGEDIETQAALRDHHARQQRRRARSRGPRAASMILLLLTVLAALITWRVPVVRMLPQTASLFAAVGLPVNLRGLEFDDIKTYEEYHDGMTVLVVEGALTNITTQQVEVPRLRFALRNASGHEVYAWTALPERPVLAARGVLPFRSRLASPPTDGRDVIVRFFNRRDALAGR